MLPGSYRVRLTANAHSVEQSFEILADPRLGSRVAELAAQLDMLRDIHARLRQCNELVNKIARLEDQIASLRRWAPAVPEMVEAVAAKLEAMKPVLIDVNMRQAQLHASGLHEKLNGLIEFVDSGDYAPAQQARDVFAELVAQLDDVTHQFDSTVRDGIPELARLVGESLSEAVMMPV